MELVLAMLRLVEPGGSETYAITIAGQLERLGHDVTLYAPEQGLMATHARESGLRVRDDPGELPDEPDALIVQDGVVSYELAARYEEVPQIFVAHSADFDLQRPPQVTGVISTVVVLNDRVGRRLEALGNVPALTRLRQPIDVRRFTDHGVLPDKPRRMLVFSKYLDRDRRRAVELVAADAGIEVTEVGGGTTTLTPEFVIGDADIVVGSGRSILEAMACGRAAYVLGRGGGDGWVTGDRYPALECDGFSGLAFGEPIDAERLRHDLAAYSPEMGTVNRTLVVQHHRAGEHAVELVHVVARAGARRRDTVRGPMLELARMVRVQWQTDTRAGGLAHALNRAETALSDAEAHAANVQEWGNTVQSQLDRLKASRRYRVMAWLARPLDAWRRRLGE
jgi:hypothetical protein